MFGNLGPETRRRCVNTLRFLAVDAVEKARSGHPGAAMGAADLAFVLWHDHLDVYPADPTWPNRDRFVLSAGHASMLLYALLHCAGFPLTLDDLKRFRQWGSKTPGHPERDLAAGVEVTTGPLGAGFSNGVGMALAARMMAARFNSEKHVLVDHRVWGIVSDGDLLEGVAAEAASLAGHLGLHNLVYLYDDNEITIEGHTRIATSDDVRRRFESCGWFVQRVDGHDHEQIDAALAATRAQTVRPSLVICRTRIGYGSAKAGTAAVHGAPLGAADAEHAKRALGWPTEPTFLVPEDVKTAWTARNEAWSVRHRAWQERLTTWRAENPGKSELWDAHWNRTVPADLEEQLVASLGREANATRVLSGKAIQKACDLLPYLVGGSADLAPSNNTEIAGAGHVAATSVTLEGRPDSSFAGRNLHFGVREHAMGGAVNGMTLHGSFAAYAATFLVFSDYMRPPIRLAALMGIPSVFVFTHDSFWVGEDGPTHEPVEHLWSLRLIPGLLLFRPCDATEVAMSWAHALRSHDAPHALIFTRQKLPDMGGERPASFRIHDVYRGGYVLSEASGDKPAVTIVATGSEVAAAVEARRKLESDGTPTRVVSMPCVELFESQPREYREAVLPPGSRLVSIEAGRTAPWYRFIGQAGLAIGLDHFGASAPGPVLAENFGFTGDAVYKRIRDWLG